MTTLLKSFVTFVLLMCVHVGSSSAEHSRHAWHLLMTDATSELCARVLLEGKTLGVLIYGPEWGETVLYFGGSIYRVEYNFRLSSMRCKLNRISSTTRQAQRR